MRTDEAVKKVARARKALQEGQQRRARATARKKFLFALAAARKALDVEYPAVKKEKVVRKLVPSRQLTFAQVADRMKRRGWMGCEGVTQNQIAVAGIKVLERRTKDGIARFVPTWAHEIAKGSQDRDPYKLLVNAKRDREYRLALVAYFQMGGKFGGAPKRRSR